MQKLVSSGVFHVAGTQQDYLRLHMNKYIGPQQIGKTVARNFLGVKTALFPVMMSAFVIAWSPEMRQAPKSPTEMDTVGRNNTEFEGWFETHT